MLVKRTGNEKIDEAPRRGYEISGYYYDGTGDYVVWKKKFWRDKPKDKQAERAKAMQKEIYG
tara:strand:- start:435 stop:620 length:186 start_codon:yes stop_codon:yes gene_type:complete